MDTLNSITPLTAPLTKPGLGDTLVDAMIKPSQIWAAGCSRLGDVMTETMVGHLAKTTAAWQAMGQVKTVKEIADLQLSYFRDTTGHSVTGIKNFMNVTNELTRDVMRAEFNRLTPISP